MATHNDITKFRAEIANLEFAARSFREAANVMRDQRDEARREASALRRRARIVVLAVIATALLVVGTVATGEAVQEAFDDEAVTFQGSIVAPRENGKEGVENEAAEIVRLKRLARIDITAAHEAALQAVPGAVHSTRLTDERGYVVYEVVVAGDDSRAHEVTVDAGNAKILQQELSEEGFHEH